MVVRIWVYLPIVIAAVLGSVYAGGLGGLEAIASFAAGALFWTLLEYLMHRLAFHGFAPHYLHHSDPQDARHIVAPLWLSFSAALVLWILTGLLAGWARAALIISGVLCGYLGYELIHLRIHSQAAGGRVLRALRKHHFCHHFASDRACFGVTSPLWDFVFSSLPAERCNAGTRRLAPRTGE